MNVLSLCAGYGGLDLAIEMIYPDARLTAYSEIEPAAVDVLEARYPNAESLGDLTTITAPPAADILTAGFPCQPASQAGRREGLDDDRWLWPDIEGLIGRMERPPALVFLENVPGLLSVNDGDAMADVVGGLAGLGFVGSWRRLRASDVGACHRRERLFIVAAHPERRGEYADRRVRLGDARIGDLPGRPPLHAGTEMARAEDPLEDRPDTPPDPRRVGVEGTLRTEPGPDGSEPIDGRHRDRLLPTPVATSPDRGSDLNRRNRPASGGDDLYTSLDRLLPTPVSSDAKGSRRETARTDEWTSKTGTTLTDAALLLPTPTKVMGDGGNIRRSGDRSEELLLGGILRHVDVFGVYAEAVARHAAVLGTLPPSPVDDRRRLAPEFVEWMMMLPAGWVTGLPLSKSAKLKMLGNGVVPPQAAAAYQALLDRLEAA